VKDGEEAKELLNVPDHELKSIEEKIDNKKIRLELNREWIPRLRMNNPYEDKPELMSDPQVKEFLKSNMLAAKQLLNGPGRTTLHHLPARHKRVRPRPQQSHR